MRKTLLLVGLAGALSAAPALARAQPLFPGSCWGHRVAGTAIGAGGGALIATAIAAGVAVTPWAWAGAGVGALLGHAIGVHTCHNHWRQAYYDQYGAPPPHPAYYPYAYYHPAHTYYAGWYRYHAHHPAAAQGYAYYYYWRGYRDAERYHEQAAPVPSGEGG